MRLTRVFFFFIFLSIVVITIQGAIATSINYNFGATYQSLGNATAGINCNAPAYTAKNSYVNCSQPVITLTSDVTLDALDGSAKQYQVFNNYNWFYSNFIIPQQDYVTMNWSFSSKFGNTGSLNISLYYYNYTSSSWIFCGNVTPTTSVVTGSCLLNYSADIYNTTTNKTNFLVSLLDVAGTVDFWYFDYVSLDVNYNDIVVNIPTTNQNILNSLSTTLNVSSMGYNSTIWYSWNGGISNNTMCTNCISPNVTTITFPRQEYYNLTVWGNKTDGTVISKNVNNIVFSNYTVTLNPSNNVSTSDWSLLFDNDWDTGTLVGDTNSPGNNTFNYTTQNITVINATWEISDADALNYNNNQYEVKYRLNISVPSICLINYANFSFKASKTSSTTWQWLCYNTSSNNYITLRTHSYSSFAFYYDAFVEEQLWMNYYSQNVVPQVNILTLNNTNISTTSFNISYNVSDDNDYIPWTYLLLDTIAVQTQQNKAIIANTNNTFNFTINNLSYGPHTYGILVTDSNGVGPGASTNTFIVDNVGPVVTFINPYVGFASSTNVSINLNYTKSDVYSQIDSCWYNVTNSSGSSIVGKTVIAGCVNTTFNLTQGEGTYNITLNINDSLGNIGQASVVFPVSMNAPSISLSYPANAAVLNMSNISLNWTASDADGILSCEIWHNFTGNWLLNKTRSDISAGVAAGEYYNLSDNDYLWNMNCSDTTNKFTFYTSNLTFSVDTTYPSVLINSIGLTSGSTSVTVNSNQSDVHLSSCKYSIINSSGGTDIINSIPTVNISFTCNSIITPTVSAFGTYDIYMYAIDSVNHETLTQQSFTTAVIVVNPPSGGGGGVTLTITDNKKVCSLIPSVTNLTFYSDVNVLLLKLTNNESFTITPSYRLNTQYFDVRTISSTIGTSTTAEVSILRKYDGNNSLSEMLTVSSGQCKDILVPVYYNSNIKMTYTINEYIDAFFGSIANSMTRNIRFYSLNIPFYVISILVMVIIVVILSFANTGIYAKIISGAFLIIFINIFLVFTIIPNLSTDTSDTAGQSFNFFNELKDISTMSIMSVGEINGTSIDLNMAVFYILFFVICLGTFYILEKFSLIKNIIISFCISTILTILTKLIIFDWLRLI